MTSSHYDTLTEKLLTSSRHSFPNRVFFFCQSSLSRTGIFLIAHMIGQDGIYTVKNAFRRFLLILRCVFLWRQDVYNQNIDPNVSRAQRYYTRNCIIAMRYALTLLISLGSDQVGWGVASSLQWGWVSSYGIVASSIKVTSLVLNCLRVVTYSLHWWTLLGVVLRNASICVVVNNIAYKIEVFSCVGNSTWNMFARLSRCATRLAADHPSRQEFFADFFKINAVATSSSWPLNLFINSFHCTVL